MTECTKLHPFKEDDHGKPCMECTQKECKKRNWDVVDCGEGNIFNGWKVACLPCTEEFGNGTLECTDGGARMCEDTHHIETIPVNEIVSNKHCKLCSDSINLCNKCTNASACIECFEPYQPDEFGQCTIMNDGDNCTRMFRYPDEDHGKACMQCNST